MTKIERKKQIRNRVGTFIIMVLNILFIMFFIWGIFNIPETNGHYEPNEKGEPIWVVDIPTEQER